MNSVNSLAAGNVLSWLPIMQLDVNTFFLKLYLNKIEAEYQKNLNDIIESEHKNSR